MSDSRDMFDADVWRLSNGLLSPRQNVVDLELERGQ